MYYQLVAFICGFISGFILLISGNTLNFVIAQNTVDKSIVGLFSCVSIPYAINFIWAPIMDIMRAPILHRFFDQRLSWIYFLQILLSLSIYYLGASLTNHSLMQIAFCGFIVALISSTHDTAIGALRAELIPQEKHGFVSGMYIFGYRVGMMLSSSGAIWLSIYISWSHIYKIFAVIVILFPLIMHITIKKCSKTLDTPMISTESLYNARNLKSLIAKIIDSLGGIKAVTWLLTFLILYRIPDNFINSMINSFLLEKNFGLASIATIGKFVGIISAILGGILGSYLMRNISIYTGLAAFGAIHALAHSLFVVQDIVGNNIFILFVVMCFESITSGMAMSSYMALITSLCRGRYKATQYAFLSATMGVSRAILPGLSGFIATAFGWKMFYLFTAIAAIPSIILLRFIPQTFLMPLRNKKVNHDR